MVRVTKCANLHKKHKKILKKTKGYYSTRSKNFKVAKQAYIKSGQYSYIHRRLKKRIFRQLWIIRINAFLKQFNVKYNYFIFLLKKNNILINRKILSNFSINYQNQFKDILLKIKAI